MEHSFLLRHVIRGLRNHVKWLYKTHSSISNNNLMCNTYGNTLTGTLSCHLSFCSTSSLWTGIGQQIKLPRYEIMTIDCRCCPQFLIIRNSENFLCMAGRSALFGMYGAIRSPFQKYMTHQRKNRDANTYEVNADSRNGVHKLVCKRSAIRQSTSACFPAS